MLGFLTVKPAACGRAEKTRREVLQSATFNLTLLVSLRFWSLNTRNHHWGLSVVRKQQVVLIICMKTAWNIEMKCSSVQLISFLSFLFLFSEYQWHIFIHTCKTFFKIMHLNACCPQITNRISVVLVFLRCGVGGLPFVVHSLSANVRRSITDIVYTYVRLSGPSPGLWNVSDHKMMQLLEL